MVIRAYLCGEVAARDAAITLLALGTGLRACDIIALRQTDIDWCSSTLGIVQQKTGNPSTLPLPAVVLGNVAEYVPGDRANFDIENVSLRSMAPHLALADPASIYAITRRILWGRRGEADKSGHTDIASPCGVEAAARRNIAADNLRNSGPFESGFHKRVVERGHRADVRLRAPDAGGGWTMSGHGFISMSTDGLEGYLAFKMSMGCYGASRIWYLKQFDRYYANYSLVNLAPTTVEGWEAEQ